MQLTSSAYQDGAVMPTRLANGAVPGGENRSMPLEWRDPPHGTRSFALAVIDRHPVARDFVHWVVAGLPADATSLPEGASGGAGMPAGAVELTGTAGAPGYHGPRPPAGSGPHPYEATLYALDADDLGLTPSDGWEELSAAMRHHVLDSASLVGRFGV